VSFLLGTGIGFFDLIVAYMLFFSSISSCVRVSGLKLQFTCPSFSCIRGLNISLNLLKGKFEGLIFVKSWTLYCLYCVHHVFGFFMKVHVENHVLKQGLNMQQHISISTNVSIKMVKIVIVVSDFAGSLISCIIFSKSVELIVFFN
jgi:hypothetical protein